MTEQEEKERIEKFNQEVKKIYGDKCEPVGEPVFNDYFLNTFTKKVGDKRIVFQLNENNLDEPYAVTIDFPNYKLAFDFLKG